MNHDHQKNNSGIPPHCTHPIVWVAAQIASILQSQTSWRRWYTPNSPPLQSSFITSFAHVDRLKGEMEPGLLNKIHEWWMLKAMLINKHLLVWLLIGDSGVARSCRIIELHKWSLLMELHNWNSIRELNSIYGASSCSSIIISTTSRIFS